VLARLEDEVVVASPEGVVEPRPHIAELLDADGAAHVRREQLTHRNDELDLRSSEKAAGRL
jgi:hypothetical protein